MYGKVYSPWVLEVMLDQALHYKAGYEVPEENEDYLLVKFFNDCEVSDHEQEHPWFHANVSPSQPHIPDAVLTLM